jgi:hypothetical protein
MLIRMFFQALMMSTWLLAEARGKLLTEVGL